MKALMLGAAVAVATLAGGAAMAQPYGYRYGGAYYDNGYAYRQYDRHSHYRRGRDSDRDGVPDYREWNRDRDRDGRPDQYDRYDNRRSHRYGWSHRYDWNDRYGAYDRYYRRGW